jgi:hypothetical protein
LRPLFESFDLSPYTAGDLAGPRRTLARLTVRRIHRSAARCDTESICVCGGRSSGDSGLSGVEVLDNLTGRRRPCKSGFVAARGRSTSRGSPVRTKSRDDGSLRRSRRTARDELPTRDLAMCWCHRSESSILVLKSLQRTGRVRSAERTEVHLVTTIRLYELTFCP